VIVLAYSVVVVPPFADPPVLAGRRLLQAAVAFVNAELVERRHQDVQHDPIGGGRSSRKKPRASVPSDASSTS
jgi:hypothetical protein